MSDTPEETTEPKTATDLAIERLTAELEQLKKDHAEQVKALEEANKSLWAAAHPALAQVTDAPPVPSSEWDVDKAVDALFDTLGRSKE